MWLDPSRVAVKSVCTAPQHLTFLGCEVVCALKEARTLRRTNRDALMDIIIISIAQEVKTVHIAKPFSTLRVLEQLVLFTVSLNDCNDL